LRTMKIYLVEWALAGYGSFKKDAYYLTDIGERKIKEEAQRVQDYLKPIKFDKMKEEISHE